MKLQSFAFLAVLIGLGVSEDPLLVSSDVNDIRFLYYPAPDNPVEIQYQNSTSLGHSGINNGKQLVILIDGFLSNNTNSNMTIWLRKSILASTDNPPNIIVVEWGALSGGNSGILDLSAPAALLMYPLVLLNVPPVGRRVGEFIGFVANETGVDPATSVWIIGHSLGAHIGGVAGSHYQEHVSPGGSAISRLSGLDPAGPLYYLSLSENDMISWNDAAWVDVYHTGIGGMGDARTNTGDINVFINGGSGQPGCSLDLLNPIAKSYCDHTYVWKWFNATIGKDVTGCPCSLGLLGLTLGTCGCKNSCSAVSICSVTNEVAVGYNATYGATGYLYVEDDNPYKQ